MRCQRCGREISPLRLLTDRDFCSERCRKKGARASAWFLRDAEYEADPLWQTPSADSTKPQPKGSNGMMAVVMVGLVGALIVAKLVFPDDSAARGGPSPVARSAPTTQPANASQEQKRLSRDEGLFAWLENRLPGSAPVKAKVDFQSNLGEWDGSAKGWVVREGVARVGELRLWKPTLGTRDYEFEFEGVVARKGMSWVFRASDSQDYYATRIQILRPGMVSGAKIIRYGVESGRMFAMAELPLPVALERHRPYRVATLVAGSRFTTLIDGRVVDEWSDPRLVKGGVGFFSSDGEETMLRWASFRERKSLWDRFASANLLLAPGLMP
jgi:hypothetical protein